MVRLKFPSAQRLKASSLLEVMVSLVIIFTVFGLATGLYTNVMRSSYTLPESMAQSELAKLAAETKKKHTYLDENITIGIFQIEKTVKPYPNVPFALEMHLVARKPENKVVAERKEILLEEK